jgi:hypothetical protein
MRTTLREDIPTPKSVNEQENDNQTRTRAHKPMVREGKIGREERVEAGKGQMEVAGGGAPPFPRLSREGGDFDSL